MNCVSPVCQCDMVASGSMEEMDGGYKGKWKQLRGGTVCGLLLLSWLLEIMFKHKRSRCQPLIGPHKRSESREEALTGANFCPRRCGGHRELQESGRRPGDRQLIGQIPGTVFAAATWRMKKVARKISRIAMTLRGAALKTGRNRLWAITSTSNPRRRPIFNIGEYRRGRRARATYSL